MSKIGHSTDYLRSAINLNINIKTCRNDCEKLEMIYLKVSQIIVAKIVHTETISK